MSIPSHRVIVTSRGYERLKLRARLERSGVVVVSVVDHPRRIEGLWLGVVEFTPSAIAAIALRDASWDLLAGIHATQVVCGGDLVFVDGRPSSWREVLYG